ncbi:MAG: hypothetical protein JWO81_2445, partial [Alphaproteobacteria bacterium]|nr:hypothetical protein [Alphaproteobacteria bacterium]
MNAITSGIEIPAAAPVEAPAAAPRPGRRMLLSALVAVALAAAGGAWLLSPGTAETTDDAYVAADASDVAPRVRGVVAQVLVRDNQAVHAGDPLVRIDPEEFDARGESAAADLAEAQADVGAAQAALASLAAEQGL